MQNLFEIAKHINQSPGSAEGAWESGRERERESIFLLWCSLTLSSPTKESRPTCVNMSPALRVQRRGFFCNASYATLSRTGMLAAAPGCRHRSVSTSAAHSRRASLPYQTTTSCEKLELHSQFMEIGNRDISIGNGHIKYTIHFGDDPSNRFVNSQISVHRFRSSLHLPSCRLSMISFTGCYANHCFFSR